MKRKSRLDTLGVYGFGEVEPIILASLILLYLVETAVWLLTRKDELGQTGG